MKWSKEYGDIIYSSQIGGFTREELEHTIKKWGTLKITVRQNPKGNRLSSLKLRRKETGRKERGRREYCCYVVDLKKTTVKSITTLIMVKILNIHWIEICL